MLPFASPASDGDSRNAARLAKLAEIDARTPVSARPCRREVDGAAHPWRDEGGSIRGDQQRGRLNARQHRQEQVNQMEG